MTSKGKRMVGGALVLFLLCYAAIQLLIRSEGMRARIESELSERSGTQVKIGDLRMTPWLSLVASGISVSKDGKLLFQGDRTIIFLTPFDLYYGRISRLSFEKPVFRLSLKDLFTPSTTSAPSFSIGTLNIDGGEFVLETGYGEPLALRSIFLNAKNLNLGGETGLRLRADVPALNGSAELSFSGSPKEKRIDIILSQGEERLLTRLLPKTAEEKGVLQAGFQIKPVEGELYEVKGAGKIDRFRVGSERIDGEFSSVFQLDPEVENLSLSLDLEMPRFPLKLIFSALPIDLPKVKATVRGDYSSARNYLTLRNVGMISSIGTLEGEGALAFKETPIGMRTTLRLRDLALEPLKTLMPAPFSAWIYRGMISADLSLSGAANDPIITGVAWNDGAKVAGEKISIGRLSSKIPFRWAGSLFQIKAARIEGKDLLFGEKGETQYRMRGTNLIGDMTTGPQRPLDMSADFQILEGRFSVPDESKVGENLSGKGRFRCKDCTGDASFTAEAHIERLDLLWNKFFGDFKDQKPSIKIDGSYQKSREELKFRSLQVSLGSIGGLRLHGSVRNLLAGPTFDLEVRTDDLRQAEFYDFFIRDTFKASYPALGQIKLSGKSSAAVRAQGSRESFTVEGKLRLEGGEIQEKSGRWRVGPVALDLPLKLRFPEATKEDSGGPPPVGRFSIGEIKTSSSAIPEVSAPVVLWNNSLRFPETIRLSLFGGDSRIDKLAWRDVIGAPADFSFSLALDNLHLLDLTEALGWYRFGGTLSGSIPEVQWEGDSLRSHGSIDLNVFGGKVAIRGMEIERPLSPVRSIKMSAKLEGIDLEQASATFEFGRISGALAGTIEDLVITHGQPAEFKANIQSVERPGVGQWISIEALNKITVLSSGNDASPLYGGLAGFFDFFRYSKLGFKTSLKNDRMLLRGVETKNGQEYLVVGTLLPPTVNIVSHTQEIGFSELLRRLERVKESESPSTQP